MWIIRFIILCSVFFCVIIGTYSEKKASQLGTFIIAWILAIIGILELILDNPNEWLGFKISFYMLLLSLSVIGNDRFDDQMKNRGCMALLGTIISMIISIIFGIINTGPTEHVDRETVQIIPIVSLNDAYAVHGSGNLFGFVISESGVYRYYYIAENGLKKQGVIDEHDVYIDDSLANWEVPYLEKVRSYDIIYGTYNKQTVIVNSNYNETVWYEFHVPKGSIVESYELDLR